MELRPPRRMLYPWLTPMHMHMHTQVPRPCALLVLNLKGPQKRLMRHINMIFKLISVFNNTVDQQCSVSSERYTQQNSHSNTCKPQRRKVHSLSISADQNWVNGCCRWISHHPRGAFTGTLPKESNLKPSQCSWRSHTQWTYGQSPIVCCAIYGSVVCHLFCLLETSMTPVWILNKRLFYVWEKAVVT